MKHPSLPTPEKVRCEMCAEGWRLVYEDKGARGNEPVLYEVWSSCPRPWAWARIDIEVNKAPMVNGNLDTILKGLAILNGEKGG